MLSIIAKKIEAYACADRSNYDRCNALVLYCANPLSVRQTEKCVAFRAFGFSEEYPSLERIIDEVRFDMQKARLQRIELLSHWVISWKGGSPKEEEVISAARELMLNLDYPDYAKMTVAIHNDTDHVHAHIVACKVDPWTEKMIREGHGWWKREAQRALARIADRHGWALEAGARFRVEPDARMEIVEAHRQGRMIQETRKLVTENLKPEKGGHLSPKALAGKAHRGVNTSFSKTRKSTLPNYEVDSIRSVDQAKVSSSPGVRLKRVARNGQSIKASFDPRTESGSYGRLNFVIVPEKVFREGLAEQQRIRERYGLNVERSLVDNEVAGYLYRCGANPDQVFSFLVENLLQAHDESRSDSFSQSIWKKQIHWEAERIALKQAPVSFIGEGSAWREAEAVRARIMLTPADKLKDKREILAEAEYRRYAAKSESQEEQDATAAKYNQ